MRLLEVYILSLWAIAASVMPGLALAAGEAERVVIVANQAFKGSVELAHYYAQQRGIPEANIISLKLPTKETITIAEYVETLHNPLLNALIQKDWLQAVKSGQRDAYGRELLTAAVHHISYLVTVHGVPLRIANDLSLLEPEAAQLAKQFKVNRGSIDSELAVLCVPQELSMTAHLKNPFFASKQPSVQDLMVGLRVSRLDGPSTGAIRRLIDRSLEAELHGLKGRAYFDMGGPHSRGDEWIEAAAQAAHLAHFDTSVETTKRLMDHRDRLDAPAIYMGWYRTHAYGPWREKQWAVPPGAIGFHLHSFSATTLRSISKGWLGPLVEQGYCATFGNVYEPYLELTHRPQMFLQRLLEGATLGEAIAYATPMWSWMGVAIGDPLYRPFKQGLEQQLNAVGEGPYDGYLAVREVRRLQAAGKEMAAIDYARSQFMDQPSLVLAYELGKLYAAAGMKDRALNVLTMIRYISEVPKEERVLAKQIADLIREQGELELALSIYRKLLDSDRISQALKESLLEGGVSLAKSVGDQRLSSRWSELRARLQQPSANGKAKRSQ